MNRLSWRLTLLCLILLCGLAACAQAQPEPATPTLPASPTPLPAATNTPTLTPSPTFTATFTPSPTPTFTPTPTPTPLLLVEAATPLPLPLDAIQPANAAQVSGLAEWTQEPVTDIAWTSSSDELAVASYNSIHLYDIEFRERFRTLYPQAAGIVDLEFAPNRSWLVAGSRLGSEQDGWAGNLELWRGPDWRPVGVLYGLPVGLSDIAFTPDSMMFISAFARPEIYYESNLDFWNVGTWEITRTLQTGTVLDLAFSPNGAWLASTPHRYAIQVRRMGNLAVEHSLFTSFTGAVSTMVFSPDSRTLASGHYDGTIRLWNVEDGSLALLIESEGAIQSLAFSPDGALLASGASYSDNSVRLWQANSGELLRTLTGHTHAVDHLLFAPNGQTLVSSSYDGVLRLWGIRP